MSKVIVREKLSRMPLDKWSDHKHVHSTGYHCKFEDGSFMTEYEDCIFEDADNCIYIDEEEEN